MTRGFNTRTALTSLAIAVCSIVAAGAAKSATAADTPPLALNTARVTIEGTSNLHPFTVSSTTVRLGRVQLSEEVDFTDFWAAIVKPGALRVFEVSIPVNTLSSPKEGLDKNMYKALKADKHPEITFRLLRIDPGAAPGQLRAAGTLTVAGVERDIVLPLTAEPKDATLRLQGQIDLLMPDFGISPPKAMLGMLRTDPKITVRLEVVVANSLT